MKFIKKLGLHNILPKVIIILILLTNNSFTQKGEKAKKINLPLTKKEIARIDDIINQMTLEEKVAMLCGNGTFCSPGVQRFGIDEMQYTDGPHGIREEGEKHSWKSLGVTTDSATFFPTGSALAATWNPELALKYGKAIGEEAKARGKDILLGPAINITRTPLGGRTFEYMSEDPFLNSRLAANYVKGVQSNGVVSCVKHFAANNQETNRGNVSAEIDERTLREIYLPAFKAAVTEGHAYSVMTAYNKINGIYCSENDFLLKKILFDEWGFNGVVISDWGGTHSTVNCALNGLDIEMGSAKYFNENLLKEVKAGNVPIDVINDKVKRILSVQIYTQKNRDPKPDGPVSTPEHNKVAYEIASQSIVLLKNNNNLLPLDISKIKSIAVIGDNATHKHAFCGFGAGVKARYEVTPLDGLKNKLENSVQLNIAKGYLPAFAPGRIQNFWRTPLYTADKSLVDEAVEIAKKSDVAIIFAGTNHDVESEGIDRTTLKLPFGQDELIKAVSAVNPRTIVVVVAGAPTDLSTALQSSNSVLYSWFNGSQAGNALADILIGNVNPSGKLPFTFPNQLEDSPAHYLKVFPGENDKANYAEGILVGYRWFDTKKIQPQLCFGYGLSYTTFDFSPIKIYSPKIKADGKIIFSLNLKNSGNKDGFETIQVYIGKENSSVHRAEKELKSFKKVFVKAGKTVKVDFEVLAKDLAYFDDNVKEWKVEPGKYKLMIASSSQDIKSIKEITVE